MRKYFGTDGIRGKANCYPLTADFTLKLGQAVARTFKDNVKKHSIVVGKDTRISGYMFENAMVSGICSMGVNAILVGVLPTPAVALMTKSLRADAGIMISASHNPYDDNGIKFFSSEGFKFSDDLELEIEKFLENKSVHVSSQNIGKALRIETAIWRYVEYVKTTFDRDIDLKGLKIVIDCGNGASYKVAPLAISELGANIILINNKPDGYNINKGCGAVHTEHMSETVVNCEADLGISFDGDGDRLIMADENGEIIDGDIIMGICAKHMKKNGALNHSTVVATVMTNIGLELSLKKENINIIRSAVGDRYVLDKMLKGGYNLGGEQSGHIIFLDYNTTGDALISALQVLKVAKRCNKPLSELKKDFALYPQILKNIFIAKKVPFDELVETNAKILDIREKLGSGGRVLVRYSGTENALRVMLEGEDQQIINEYADDIKCSVKDEINKSKGSCITSKE